MAGSVFITYGVKSGGGPAFLRRTRQSSNGQRQTRTRTTFFTSQVQRRTATCRANMVTSCGWDLTSFVGCISPGACSSGCSAGATRQCSAQGNVMCGSQGCTNFPLTCSYNAICRCSESLSTRWLFGSWSNISTCSATSASCSTLSHNNNTRTECQTISVCNWNAFTAWTNVGSCTASSPGCSSGVTQRECRTFFEWGPWSAFEEVDICIPANPGLGAGNIEVQCVPQ